MGHCSGAEKQKLYLDLGTCNFVEFVNSYIFKVYSLEFFHTWNHVICKYGQLLSNPDAFYFILLPKRPRLEPPVQCRVWSGDSGHPCLAPGLGGKALSVSWSSVMLAVSSCRCDHVRKFPLSLCCCFSSFIYVFIFGCAGPSLLCLGSLELQRVGACPWGGLPCAESRPSDTRASVLAVGGSVFLAF